MLISETFTKLLRKDFFTLVCKNNKGLINYNQNILGICIGKLIFLCKKLEAVVIGFRELWDCNNGF